MDTATSAVDAGKRDEVERGATLFHGLERHCFIMKEAVATFQAPKVEIATSAVDARKRDEEARRVAKGGKAGGRRLATKGRGVRHQQGDKLAGKAAGKRLASVVAGGGRWGPSVDASRSAARNLLRPGARAGRSGGPAAWGPNVAGIVSWSNPSSALPDGFRADLDGAETSAIAAQRGISRPPRQTQLTESAGCWTRRRRHGADGGTRVEIPVAVRGGWQGARPFG